MLEGFPKEIKELFTKGSVRKNIRIRFPNGERDDITNNEIVSESFRFSESLCSQTTFKFGLCEASSIEFTVINVGNIKGYEIEVGIEIDISSLGKDFITEFGHTSADVEFTYYYVPYGRFTVDSCKRQKNTTHREIVAYNALHSEKMDTDLSDIGVRSSNKEGFLTYDAVSGQNYKEFFRFNLNHYLRMFSINSGMSNVATEFGSPAGTFEEEENGPEQIVPIRVGTSGMAANLYVKNMVYKPSETEMTNFGLNTSLRLAAYEKRVREQVNRVFEKYGIVLDETFNSIIPSTNEITVALAKIEIMGIYDEIIEDEDEMGLPMSSRYITPSLMLEWSDFENIKELKLQVPLRLEIVQTSTGDLPVITPLETITFEECPIVEFYSYPSDSILSYSMRDDVKITSYRSMLSSFFELKGCFGRIDRITNKLECAVLGNQTILMDKSMLKQQGVWVEEYKTKEYGAISAKYTDSSGEEQILLYRFGEGENTYYIQDNFVLNSLMLTTEHIQSILEELSLKLKEITMVPFEITAIGLPFLEAGELLEIETEEGTIKSYMLKRELDGIFALADTFSNSVEEKAVSNIDHTQAIVAMNTPNDGVTNIELAETLERLKEMFAKKEIYGDDHLSLERKKDAVVGGNSFAMGSNNEASGWCSHAEGQSTVAEGDAAHAEGYITEARGTYSHAEGYGTVASYWATHAEGYHTQASGIHSHAEGQGTVAAGRATHAEGYYTRAGSNYSHAEGYQTIAVSDYSHAEGLGTVAEGKAAHAEGSNTEASCENSHAEGESTISASPWQHVQGKYNKEDKEEKYAHIVGNGNYKTRSNAHTLDWNGNAWYAGDVENGAGVSLNGLKSRIDNLSFAEESDPTVPDWAKADTKPSYSAEEVGADPSGSAQTAEQNANKYTDGKVDELNKIYLGINDNAVSATKATQDADGNVITNTYATKGEIERTELTNEDLNNLMIDGKKYYTRENNTCAHKPKGVDAFSLDVIRTANGWYTHILIASNNQEVIYVRYYNTSVEEGWGDWRQLAFNDSIEKKYATKEEVENISVSASGVTGIKGNKENDYRKGNVNITAENVGALPEDGTARMAFAVADYNDRTNPISIGWRGNDLTLDEFHYFAGYNSDASSNNVKIKSVPVVTVKEKLGLPELEKNLYRMWGSYYDGDLDDLATYGTSIYNTQVGTEKHSPTGRWGFVITFGHAYATTHATQLFLGMTDTGFYYRRKDGDWWSDWGEIAFDNHFSDRIKTLEGVLTPTQTGLLSELPTGVFQYWGTYPKDAPFSVPFIVASYRAYNFRMQIASDYTGGYIVHRSRGAAEAEWSDWHTFRTTNNAPSGKGIEFQIVNGELQYRYDKEVWG